MSRCLVDLSRADYYRGDVPDADVETCLKVLRSIRNAALRPETFDAETAVMMSHAHAKIHDLVARLKTQEAGDEAEASPR